MFVLAVFVLFLMVLPLHNINSHYLVFAINHMSSLSFNIKLSYSFQSMANTGCWLTLANFATLAEQYSRAELLNCFQKVGII